MKRNQFSTTLHKMTHRENQNDHIFQQMTSTSDGSHPAKLPKIKSDDEVVELHQHHVSSHALQDHMDGQSHSQSGEINIDNKPPVSVSEIRQDQELPQVLQRTDNAMPRGPLPESSKKPRSNLPKSTTNMLKAWLFDHHNHPYPSDLEKREMSEKYNLTLTQINNWFINARRRLLHPLKSKARKGNVLADNSDKICNDALQRCFTDLAQPPQASTTGQNLVLFAPVHGNGNSSPSKQNQQPIQYLMLTPSGQPIPLMYSNMYSATPSNLPTTTDEQIPASQVHYVQAPHQIQTPAVLEPQQQHTNHNKDRIIQKVQLQNEKQFENRSHDGDRITSSDQISLPPTSQNTMITTMLPMSQPYGGPMHDSLQTAISSSNIPSDDFQFHHSDQGAVHGHSHNQDQQQRDRLSTKPLFGERQESHRPDSSIPGSEDNSETNPIRFNQPSQIFLHARGQVMPNYSQNHTSENSVVHFQQQQSLTHTSSQMQLFNQAVVNRHFPHHHMYSSERDQQQQPVQEGRLEQQHNRGMNAHSTFPDSSQEVVEYHPPLTCSSQSRNHQVLSVPSATLPTENRTDTEAISIIPQSGELMIHGIDRD